MTNFYKNSTEYHNAVDAWESRTRAEDAERELVNTTAAPLNRYCTSITPSEKELKKRRAYIMDVFEQEPLDKTQASELIDEVREIDDTLGYYDYTPTPKDMPVIDMDNIQEIKF